MAVARRPPRHTRPKPVKPKAKRTSLDDYEVKWGDDDILSKLTPPNKNAKLATGVKWVCDVCGGRWPVFTDKNGALLRAKECVEGVGCPSCAPGLVDEVARVMPRFEFDPRQCPDLAERGAGLKEGEFAVSWQFKYPPFIPPKEEDEDPTGMGPGVGWGSLNVNAVAQPFKHKVIKAKQRQRWFARPPLRLKDVNGKWVTFDDVDVDANEEVLADPEGRIVRNATEARFVNRQLHPTHDIVNGQIRNASEARPRKYLRVVDHTGRVWSFDALLEHFDVKKSEPWRHTTILHQPEKLETVSHDELREVFKLVSGIEMTDERGADLDNTPLAYPVLSQRVKAEKAFEARREAIRKDGGGDALTRLFHGTCAHNIRSVLKHGLEPSTWAVNSALGPGIYLGELKKAASFSHACDFLHFLEGFVEGERVGRRFRGKLQNGAGQVVGLIPASTAGIPALPALPALPPRAALTPSMVNNITKKTAASVWSTLTSVSSAHIDLSALDQTKFTEMIRFFVEQLRDEFDDDEWDVLCARTKPRNLLDVWAGARPGRIERRWKKKNILARLKFVFEVDVLLGNSYRITDPDQVVNNDTPKRFAFRRGSHSVYCTRFKQDEWCVYRTDQVHLRRINVYVDNEGVPT